MRPIRSVRVFDAVTGAAETYAREMSAALGIEVVAAACAREAVGDADIVCAASTSRTPVFADADLKPGTHLNAVGSYQPTVQEITLFKSVGVAIQDLVAASCLVANATKLGLGTAVRL